MNKCKDYEPVHTTRQKTQKTIDLSECFELFQVPEELDKENTWYCAKCKEHVKAIKKLQIYRAPKVLILHLKRFKTNYYMREKLSTPVLFKEKGLDISQYVLGE